MHLSARKVNRSRPLVYARVRSNAARTCQTTMMNGPPILSSLATSSASGSRERTDTECSEADNPLARGSQRRKRPIQLLADTKVRRQRRPVNYNEPLVWRPFQRVSIFLDLKLSTETNSRMREHKATSVLVITSGYPSVVE